MGDPAQSRQRAQGAVVCGEQGLARYDASARRDEDVRDVVVSEEAGVGSRVREELLRSGDQLIRPREQVTFGIRSPALEQPLDAERRGEVALGVAIGEHESVRWDADL